MQTLWASWQWQPQGRGQGRGPLSRLPSMFGQRNFAFAVPPRFLGYIAYTTCFYPSWAFPTLPRWFRRPSGRQSSNSSTSSMAAPTDACYYYWWDYPAVRILGGEGVVGVAGNARTGVGVIGWSFPRSHIWSWPESRRTITSGLNVSFPGRLYAVEGVDGAGCEAGYTLEPVAYSYCTSTAGPPEPPLAAFGLLAPSARPWWVGRRQRWHSGDTRSTLPLCGERSCRPPPWSYHPAIRTARFGYITGLPPLSRGSLERGEVDAW